jgi:site-specific recombinase XerD
MQLTEAIEELLVATRADGRSQETIKGYRRKLRQFLAFFGNVVVEEITVNDVRRYIAHLWDRTTRWADHPKRKEQKGGLSPYTVASHVRAIKRLFNFLEAEGVIEINPTRRIKTPDPRQREPKAIALQDFLALLAVTEGQSALDRRDRAIILLLADTGCRVGGLCGLRVQDVDLERGLVTVTEKGSKTRLVPFTKPTSEALQAWLEVHPQSPWLFVSLGSRAKGALSPNGVAQMLRRRAKKAGVEGRVNPHSFRHGFAREYLMDGGDLASLSDLLGHSSVEVTKQSYAVFSVAELQEKHARHSPVARLLGGENDEHS